MHRIGRAILVLCLTAVAGTLGTYGQDEATGGSPALLQPCEPCELLTIAKGEHSGWGVVSGSSGGFLGADIVIRDAQAWVEFWRVHSYAENEPTSVTPPPIDFDRQVVIAAIQGQQSSGGGPNISIAEVEPEGPIARVIIVDDERPGPLEMITNPFHIVAVSRWCLPEGRSIAIEHVAPIPGTGVVVGRVFGADPDGARRPLPNALVTLAMPGGVPRQAMSGLDGSYFILNVAPGHYALSAEHPEFFSEFGHIEVHPDTLTAHDFELIPRPDYGTILGHVFAVDSAGNLRPLPGALVLLIGDNSVVPRYLWTNEHGFYEFEQVLPGDYMMVAFYEGFIPGVAFVAVAPDEVVEQDFVLRPHSDTPPGESAGSGMRVTGEVGAETPS